MRPEKSFIGQPVRSLQTMLRVIANDNSRIPAVVPDGIYGPGTMNAVTAFQRLYGIPVTGVTNQNTWEEIVTVYDSSRIRVEKAEPIEVLLEPGQVIALGEGNPYIFLLQAMLTYLSMQNDHITAPSFSGVLDEETAGSIAAFQRIAGIDDIGVLDRHTWFHLARYFTLEAHKENES